jgi:hypothetical protein
MQRYQAVRTAEEVQTSRESVTAIIYTYTVVFFFTWCPYPLDYAITARHIQGHVTNGIQLIVALEVAGTLRLMSSVYTGTDSPSSNTQV